MKRNVLTQYLIITASCALYAVGFNWMFDPNHISVGGFTGLGQIINYLLPGLPIGTIVIILNVPLFVLGWRFIGKDFLFSSVYATAVSSLMIDGLAAVHTFKPMEPILACLYGGVIIGVSCGIMLREGATTGGTELAARLLKLKLESLSIGTLCLATDILVTVTYALIFRDLTRALYGMISLSLISVSIDKVVYGPNAAKVAYIISDCHEELTRRLLELELRGQQADYETILHDIIRRDEQDRNRPVAPLRQAEDAVLVDTTRLNLEESLEALLAAIKERTDR